MRYLEHKFQFTERIPLAKVLEKLFPREESEHKNTKKKHSTTERLMLYAIFQSPFRKIKDLYKALKLSACKANRIKKQLLALGLIQELEFSKSGRGRNIKLLQLTPAGLKEIGVSLEDMKSKGGGFLHRKFQQHVAKFYENKGYIVTIEKDLNGKQADICLEKEDRIIALEIALMSAEYELVNVEKDLQAGFTEIFCCCRTKKILTTIQKQVKEKLGLETLAKVKFCLLTSYLKGESI